MELLPPPAIARMLAGPMLLAASSAKSRAGQNLDFGIDDASTGIGHDHLLVASRQSQRSGFRHILDQQLRLGFVGRRLEKIHCGCGGNARKGKDNDLPLVAKQHIVDVAHGHPR